MLKKLRAAIKFKPFSLKQKKILTWWCPGSPYKDFNGIIADGAIRAGKTVPMALSFVIWAMDSFDLQNFAMCGKSIGTFKRNVWVWLKPVLMTRGYKIKKVPDISETCFVITFRGKVNYFYIFGGKDERSQDFIQGITLAGIYFDEVALMPESFVNQGTGRCSVEGAKYWFNCNPDSPMHWFKINWIDQAAEKKLLHLHFVMDDNLSLSEERKATYRSMWTGVFYQRFILGLWVMAQGAIFKDSWNDDENLFDDSDVGPGFRDDPKYRRYIAIDYGTVNPMVFGDIYDDGQTIWVYNEFYYNSRDPKNHGIEKTDDQYADDLVEFIGNHENQPLGVIIDPSAASFKVVLRKRGLVAKEAAELINADNEVLDGIRMVSSLLLRRRIKIHRTNCPMTKAELLSYVWDDKAIQKGMKEKPVKVNDHCPDMLRYFVKTMIGKVRFAA